MAAEDKMALNCECGNFISNKDIRRNRSTDCNRRPDISTRYKASYQDADPYTPVWRLESVQGHKLLFQRERIISCEGIEQPRARSEIGNRSHHLGKQHHNQTHLRQLGPDSIIEELRNWDGICGGLNGRDVLDCEKK